jgi:hypothetical protein
MYFTECHDTWKSVVRGAKKLIEELAADDAWHLGQPLQIPARITNAHVMTAGAGREEGETTTEYLFSAIICALTISGELPVFRLGSSGTSVNDFSNCVPSQRQTARPFRRAIGKNARAGYLCMKLSEISVRFEHRSVLSLMHNQYLVDLQTITSFIPKRPEAMQTASYSYGVIEKKVRALLVADNTQPQVIQRRWRRRARTRRRVRTIQS